MTRKFLQILPLLALLLLASVAVAQEDGDAVVIAPGDNVVLGLATILSGEGLVPLGADIQRGVELALEDRPTVVVGEVEFALALDVQDDQCSAEGGLAVANYYASQPGVVGVVGPTCSSACRAAGPIFDEAGFTTITSSCTAVDLTAEETGFASFNRTTANDALQGAAAAQFIFNELGLTQIATIHDGSPYGEGLVEELTAGFTALGGEIVYSDAVEVGETNFRTLLDNIAGTDAQLIYFGGFPAEAARIAQQRTDSGLADTPMMGADGINSSEFTNLAADAAEGVYASSPVPPTNDAVAAFTARYTETYGTEPTASFNTYAYDATNILLDAIEATGSIDADGNLVLSRAAISEFVRSFGAEEAYDGLSGVLSCAGNGDCATGGIGFFQVQDGAYVRLESMMEPVATEEAEG
jgi:branched-chain amino acid transport system substrate-binding protein